MPFFIPFPNKLDRMLNNRDPNARPMLDPQIPTSNPGSLNKFISQVKSGGLASANMFAVEMAIPNVVRSTYGDFHNLQAISLFCDQVQLPDQNISTAQVRTYGEVRETPYENLYGNINMSFICDSDYKTKHFFDTWIQNISNPETRHINYYKDYVVPVIRITTLNSAEAEVYRVALYECYPKQIQAVTLDYASKEVVKVSVSMNYKYWRSALRSDAVSHEQRYFAYDIPTVNSGGTTRPTKLVDILRQQGQQSFDKYQQMYNNTVGDVQNIITGLGNLF
jgi:hypothetical protein